MKVEDFAQHMLQDARYTSKDALLDDKLADFSNFLNEIYREVAGKIDTSKASIYPGSNSITYNDNYLKASKYDNEVKINFKKEDIDHWIVKNDKVVSEKYGSEVNRETFEKYLDLFF
ncbi:hypothetical protein [Facklamia miroungae]|uniref:Uncharacterized protein n=1 Tax=Facklamia miroungae TaxID=120956 RepID=A0A1G7NYV2_9LACT|nr:hypothetical protein [Facklamia miroungae]NKZ28514.1 hypothetical protein [Facklamia miroungae]SDF79027.1 hypothetical protein SAMN05421791_10155 [Facklamia miroungae]